jgi:3-oxoacyl-[acyl-carrier protein] reductase
MASDTLPRPPSPRREARTLVQLGRTRTDEYAWMKDEDWQKVIDVNLSAGFRLSRAALRGMMKRKWGRIVGITSIVGVTGNPGQAN